MHRDRIRPLPPLGPHGAYLGTPLARWLGNLQLTPRDKLGHTFPVPVQVSTVSVGLATARLFGFSCGAGRCHFRVQTGAHLVLHDIEEHLGFFERSFFKKTEDVDFFGNRLQEQAYDGLKPATRKRLQKLTAELEQSRKSPLALLPQLKTGTKLLRQWQGEMHEVLVADEGFEYRGKRYESLSEIAREITGTRWSGPLFFGLKQSRKARSAQ